MTPSERAVYHSAFGWCIAWGHSLAAAKIGAAEAVFAYRGTENFVECAKYSPKEVEMMWRESQGS